MTTKKKNITLTMEQRLNVLEDLKTLSPKKVALKYNVVKATIQRIQKNSSKIMEFADKSHVQMYRQRVRKSLYHELEQSLLTWFRERKALGNPLSNALLLEKAAELKNTMESCSNFKVSSGWLEGFKVRHNIRLLRYHGESANADEDGAKKFIDNFQKLMEEEGIIPENVYNMDETGLLWKALPSKTLVERKEKLVKGYKRSTERITVALCANASGTHKLMPIVINRYQNPRALKHYEDRLPVILRAQSNIWMTESLFTDWYQNDFQPSVRAHQATNSTVGKVILLLNNFKGHTVPTEMLESEDFKIMYLPPNTTSFIQPMSNGIIAKLKLIYRRKTLRRAASYACGLNEFYKHFTIKDCVHLLDRSWTEITADNIRNAWKKIIPEQRDVKHRVAQHVSLETEKTVSEGDLMQSMSNCEEVESRISTKEENVEEPEEANEDTREEEPEDEGEKLIVPATETCSREELKYLLERLSIYASREPPNVQQVFQVFKNHFLGTMGGIDNIGK